MHIKTYKPKKPNKIKEQNKRMYAAHTDTHTRAK